jgi:subtilisin family serine protease
MLRNTIMIIALLAIGSLNSFAQNDYYWSGGKQIFMNKTSTKKFVVVDSSIVNQNELDSVLNDSSLIITGFFERNIIPQINLRDSAYLNKNFAIIESRDSIKPDTLLNNSCIHYVSDYYQISDIDIGTSNLLYVKLSDMQDTLVLDSISTANGVNVLGNFSNSPSWFILECTDQSESNTLDMANMFYESGLFVYSHPNLLNNFHPTCTNDPYLHKQWGLNNNLDHDNIDINACDAWSITKGDPNVVIAVLDSGIKLDHPDLSNVDVSLSYDLMAGSSPSSLYYSLFWVDFNHGTNCAGIIGAQHNNIGVSGIAPNSTLMSLSLNWNLGGIPLDQALNEGLNHAWQNGADVISNSWSGAYNEDIVIDAIDQAISNGRNGLGCEIVNSTGNGNSSALSPTQHAGVIGVGAIDSCGIRCTRKKNEIPEFQAMCGTFWGMFIGSNYGNGLSVVAPGSDVATTSIVDDNWVSEIYTAEYHGTSAAAPHVSGVAALLLSVNPDLTYTEVKDIIEQTAQKISADLDFYDYDVSKPNGMWDEKLGYGLVDAYAAVTSVFCHDDVFIESTDNITWSDETNLCENLTVEGVLTINAPVHIYSDLPEITIQNGGHLIFDTGSELYYRDVENFAGNINVEAGSTLQFKNGSDIVLAENGKIMVSHDSNNSGELVFNSGASLTLLDDNTNLEIAGDLNIASNATFTYTGDGYIKFSNPGGDATNNIFCGSGASIVLQGSGQNDKIMEVQQSRDAINRIPTLLYS